MRKVLIADDDFISIEVLKAMLASFEVDLLVAMTGEEALKLAEQSACREAGMDATLHKPVSPEALSELMSEYLP